MRTALRDELLAWIGQPMSGGGPTLAPDPVNLPMIRHWVDAFDDRNPVYLDEDAAVRAGFGGIVAPAGDAPDLDDGPAPHRGHPRARRRPTRSTPTRPIAVLGTAGFRGTLATNSELEFDRPSTWASS